jgi:hypothetical protein
MRKLLILLAGFFAFLVLAGVGFVVWFDSAYQRSS